MANTATIAGTGRREITKRKSTNTALRRFIRHRLALLGIAVMAIFCLMAIFAPQVAMRDPYRVNLDELRSPPSAEHFLGTDAAGRDVWARLVYGARVSLAVGLSAVLVSGLIGTVIGLVSGYFGGRIDMLLMRFTELVMTFPTFFAIILLVSLIGPSIYNVILVIGVFGWTGLARLVRGQALALREMEYVQAARSIGATNNRILLRHILPALMPYVMVATTLGLATAILTEASLSFLGLGVRMPMATWGTMLNAAQSINVLESQPWLWIPPGLCLGLAVLATNFIGDGLRDALDPHIKV